MITATICYHCSNIESSYLHQALWSTLSMYNNPVSYLGLQSLFHDSKIFKVSQTKFFSNSFAIKLAQTFELIWWKNLMWNDGRLLKDFIYVTHCGYLRFCCKNEYKWVWWQNAGPDPPGDTTKYTVEDVKPSVGITDYTLYPVYYLYKFQSFLFSLKHLTPRVSEKELWAYSYHVQLWEQRHRELSNVSKRHPVFQSLHSDPCFCIVYFLWYNYSYSGFLLVFTLMQYLFSISSLSVCMCH